MSVDKWMEILEEIGPEILLFTPFAPIAPALIAGIRVANETADTGAEKLANVVQVAGIAAQGLNAQVGRTVIDPQVVAASAAGAISSVVQIVNSLHAASQVDPASVPVGVKAATPGGQ